MVNNAGHTMTIYDIPGIIKRAYPLAATPNNITAGLRLTGINPFNRNIFSDADFGPGYATDRPMTDNATVTYISIADNREVNNKDQQSGMDVEHQLLIDKKRRPSQDLIM